MKSGMFGWSSATLLLLVSAPPSSLAQPIEAVSTIDGSQPAAAAGGGDSGAPILSPDGRYVLFASTAGNLSVASNSAAYPFRVPANLNIFLRDRANGTTKLVSVNSTGTGGGNGDSLPCGLSTNGQFALFESSASDLVHGDTNGVTDIFLRDLTAGTTLLVSASTNGNPANGASRSATMTPDGRYIAFVSAGSNLLAGDTNGIADIFLGDTQTGAMRLVSAGAKPASSSSSSECPDITPDGRYVAFYSTATNLTAGSHRVQDVYVRDLVGSNTVWASTGAAALGLSVLHTNNLVCYNHAISADGKFVVYETGPAPGVSTPYPGLILRYSVDTGLTDLVHTNAAIQPPTSLDIRNLDITPDGQRIAFVANTNGTSGSTTCILLWDATTGVSTLISGGTNNLIATNRTCDWPRMDPTGQFVAFNSGATNLTTNVLVGEYHLYIRDVQAGTTRLVDANANGVSSVIGPLTAPSLNVDGRFIAFECADAFLVPNDRNRDADLFVSDLATNTVELISAHDPALGSITPNGPSQLSTWCLSMDGRFIAFAGEADNLVMNDTNGLRDIFVRDRLNNTNILVSADTNGVTGDNLSFEPAMSGDGRYVAFTSHSDDLVDGDTNRASDVFVRDLQTGVTRLASINSSGTGPGNNSSYSPQISSGGRYVMFRSKAGNLAAGAFSGTENLFVRDTQTATTYALTTNGMAAASMTPAGDYVAFVDMVGTSSGSLYVWASASATRVYTFFTNAISAVAISPDGQRVAFLAGSVSKPLTVQDRLSGTTWMISSNAPSAHAGLRFSADHRFLAYTTIVNKTNEVFLYDFQAGTNLPVSRSYSSGAPGNNSSDSPDISADARFVAYRSTAADIAPGVSNGLPQIFVFDREIGMTTLLSVSRFGNYAANNRSLCPVFSADGQTLVFETWASDLANSDFNHSSDVMSYSLSAAGAVPAFYATIYSGGPSSVLITWPALPEKSYRVQYKNDLGDSNWQELGGNVTIVGSQGYCQDFRMGATRRFYRVLGY